VMATTGIKLVRRIDDLMLFHCSGTVLDCQVAHSTHVSGSGGGYNNIPISIGSSTTEHQRIFIQDDEGGEFEFSYSNLGIGVRKGNRVTIIYAGHKSGSKGQPIAVVNADTRKFVFLERALDSATPQGPSGCAVAILIVGLAIWLLIALILYGAGSILTAGTNVAIIVGICVFIVMRYIARGALRSAIRKRVDLEIQRVS